MHRASMGVVVRTNAFAIISMLVSVTIGSKPMVAELQRGCDSGFAADCDYLGHRYLSGDGVASDETAATALFQRACDDGDAPGCFDLAISYNQGRGVQSDDRLAASASNRSCNGRFQPGCDLMGTVYENGLGGFPRDRARAASLYQHACDSGVDVACTHLNELNSQTQLTPAPSATAASSDSPAATTLPPPDNLNTSIDAAISAYVRKDYATAAQLFAGACDHGGYVACFRLAEQYENGTGVVVNMVVAAKLYAKACDNGIVASCSGLGLAYSDGRGIKENDALAGILFKKACDRSFFEACAHLGRLAEAGSGVIQSKQRAFTLYTQACDGGSAIGCSSLGLMYSNGDVVTKNDSTAMALYRLACERGGSDGCRYRDIIEDQLRRERQAKSDRAGAAGDLSSHSSEEGQHGADAPARVEKSRHETETWMIKMLPRDETALSPIAPSRIAGLVEQAVAADSKSWLINRYKSKTIRNVRIVDRFDELMKVSADFLYSDGTQSRVHAIIEDDHVACLRFADTPLCNWPNNLPYTPKDAADCISATVTASTAVYVDRFGDTVLGSEHRGGSNGTSFYNRCSYPVEITHRGEYFIFKSSAKWEKIIIQPNGTYQSNDPDDYAKSVIRR